MDYTFGMAIVCSHTLGKVSAVFSFYFSEMVCQNGIKFLTAESAKIHYCCAVQM